jgi:RNA polymerase sigma-70 factor (ECF subfamily)
MNWLINNSELLRYSQKHSSDESDESCLNRYRLSGHLEVLGSLYSRYMHLVYGVCLKYLENREDAKDAVMQIFEKLITEARHHEIKQFRSWLYVLTKNYCLMQIRSQKAKARRINSYKMDHIKSVESVIELHPIDEENAEKDLSLKECIEKLNNEQKNCIRLFYFENKCYREIAESLNTDEKKVKSHLQNAKRNLKICLEKRNETE